MLLIYKLVSHLISHVGIRSKTVYINLSEYTKNIEYRNTVSAKWRKVRKTVSFRFWLLHKILLSSLCTITSTLFHIHLHPHPCLIAYICIMAYSFTSTSLFIYIHIIAWSLISTFLLVRLHLHPDIHLQPIPCSFTFTSLLARLHPHACSVTSTFLLDHLKPHHCLFIYNHKLVQWHPHSCVFIFIDILVHFYPHPCVFNFIYFYKRFLYLRLFFIGFRVN